MFPAICDRGLAYLALAGGGTPVAAYTLLSQPEYASRIEWSRLQIFWSDERLAPPDHVDSNYRLVAQALLRDVPIPPENIHRMHGELLQAEAPQAYENEMRAILAADNQSAGRPTSLRSSPGRTLWCRSCAEIWMLRQAGR